MWQALGQNFARNSEKQQVERNSSRHRCLYFAASFSDGLATSVSPSRRCSALLGSSQPAEDPPYSPARRRPARGSAGFRLPPGPAATAPPAARLLTTRGGCGGVSMAAPLGLRLRRPPPPAPFQLRTPAPPASSRRVPSARAPAHRRPAPAPAPAPAQKRPCLLAQLCSPHFTGASSACRRCWGGAAGRALPGVTRPSHPAPPLPAAAEWAPRVGSPARNPERET